MKTTIRTNRYFPVILFCILILIGINESLSQIPYVCGTITCLDRLRKGGSMPERPILSGTEQTINTTNFKIHYTFSGSDATTQAWVDSMVVYAEQCWTACTNLGWATPPPDSKGGDSRYDIYICNTVVRSGEGEYGSTKPEDGFTSWTEIHNDFAPEPLSGFPFLHYLIAHEFHHACQNTYRSNGESWFVENTATYMGHVIYEGFDILPFFLRSHLKNPFVEG